ncbi:hypothetical protein Lepto7376_2418 [[Leptolyngbya] sp. PCC 7376]|uniref:hypothetical protein n=1 Tax=[Leptolyngbya] sp. PCC 7376 TaxID=111781 RepID=UPI00029F353F|nr:hypothetical protein [[Leptolyngbya] sp. PCC 7376]AFY38698.1 hypothetical protein Lepto7376_2418 [[Leptolyngbya] sp. PCC 7376]
MNDLLQQIQSVLSSGTISSEEEQCISQLLWRTPMTKQMLDALRKLEHELDMGNLSFK